VGQHDASVHDVQPWLAEQAQVGIDGAGFAAVTDRDPADEVSRGAALDDSNSSAPARLPTFSASRPTNFSTTGMCTAGAAPAPCRLRSRPSSQYSSMEVSVVCEQSMMVVMSAMSFRFL
jgi:hypothetical protein